MGITRKLGSLWFGGCERTWVLKIRASRLVRCFLETRSCPMKSTVKRGRRPVKCRLSSRWDLFSSESGSAPANATHIYVMGSCIEDTSNVNYQNNINEKRRGE